jgi:hypothetical protein
MTDVSHLFSFCSCVRLAIKKLLCTERLDCHVLDIVWIHDYHLMLLPQMLREEIGSSKKNVKIGYFLHTPFPSSEIYRIRIRRPVQNFCQTRLQGDPVDVC